MKHSSISSIPSVTTLVCLPFGGASSAVFSKWQILLPKEITILALDYPGHGKDFNEPLLSEIKPLVSAMLSKLPADLNHYYLYGHSLGALVGFEMLRSLQAQKRSLPHHLIVSGSNSPKYPDEKENIGHLPNTEFLAEMQKRYRGFTEQILKENELLNVILPIIRADVLACEKYIFEEEPKLTCPITAIAAFDDEDIKPEKFKAWGDLTTQTFRQFMIPGDHLSMFSEPTSLIKIIENILISSSKARA